MRFISSSRILQTETTPLPPPSPPVVVTDPITPIDNIATNVDAITPLLDTVPELGYYPSHLVCQALDYIHTFAGIPYWEAIIVGTIAFRLLLLPSNLISLRASSRIAAVRPQIDALTKRAEKDPDNRALYQQEIIHLNKLFKVSYVASFGQPVIQLPVFLSVFFALRQMGTFFPDYSTGGGLWFPDLAAADPTYILPIANALSFLLVAEFGADELKVPQHSLFKPFVRVFSIASVGLTYFLPSGLLLFWCTNNALSTMQNVILRQPGVSKYIGILPPPADAPPLKPLQNPFKNFFKNLTSNKSDTIEYIGKAAAPPVTYNPQKKRELAEAAKAAGEVNNQQRSTGSSKDSSFSSKSEVETPPPVTFAAPPKKKPKKII